MGENRIVILTAVELEARAIAGALRSRGYTRPQVFAVGVGAIRRPTLDAAPPVDWLIAAGLAGGLDPTLKSGDLVMTGTPAGFAPRAPFRIGSIHTATAIVSTVEEKVACFGSTGALAVDMESALLRPLADSLGASFIDLRVILDTAGETLCGDLARLVDPFGRAKPSAIASHLLRHPLATGELLRLARSTRSALKILAAAVAGLVEHVALTNPTDRKI